MHTELKLQPASGTDSVLDGADDPLKPATVSQDELRFRWDVDGAETALKQRVNPPGE